ncbi:hypothetical protein ACIA8O_31250 [Kitasatospora sp. NPDC051853]|uniref:hypothetical protein n=1 Tax=Kitasatospora sp. NPDC051853 TaxID=3364058 RepID=UPI003797720B
MPAVTPPGEPPVVRAEVIVTGEVAEAITALARLLDRTPEELAIEHAAGIFPIPDGPNNLDWGLFDSGELTAQERSTPLLGLQATARDQIDGDAE